MKPSYESYGDSIIFRLEHMRSPLISCSCSSLILNHFIKSVWNLISIKKDTQLTKRQLLSLLSWRTVDFWIKNFNWNKRERERAEWRKWWTYSFHPWRVQILKSSDKSHKLSKDILQTFIQLYLIEVDDHLLAKYMKSHTVIVLWNELRNSISRIIT